MVTIHCWMGVEFGERSRPNVVVPVHYDDYGVFRSPLTDFLSRMSDSGLPADVRAPRRGDEVSLEP